MIDGNRVLVSRSRLDFLELTGEMDYFFGKLEGTWLLRDLRTGGDRVVVVANVLIVALDARKAAVVALVCIEQTDLRRILYLLFLLQLLGWRP